MSHARFRSIPRCLVLGAFVFTALMTGCSGDDGPSDAGRPSERSGSTQTAIERSSAPEQRYAATLETIPPSSGAPRGSLTLTNTGTRADRYLLRLVPPATGEVTPRQVELDPGKSATLLILGGDPRVQPVVEAFSTQRDDVVAQTG